MTGRWAFPNRLVLIAVVASAAGSTHFDDVVPNSVHIALYVGGAVTKKGGGVMGYPIEKYRSCHAMRLTIGTADLAQDLPTGTRLNFTLGSSFCTWSN
jgi:hypothetical protein